MRIFLLSEDYTIEQDIYLNIEVDSSSCTLIRVGNQLTDLNLVRNRLMEIAPLALKKIDFHDQSQLLGGSIGWPYKY
jgi:hypothetical protein